MVSEPWEFHAARDVFDQQLAWLKKQKHQIPTSINYGVMLEVPSLAETLDLLLPHVKFVSIGTNDLTQFLFAADRANPALAERYDWLSPSILRFLARVVQSCVGQPVNLGVCGEMGGRRLEALALIGLGIRRLSITPAAVGQIKELVRRVDTREIAEAMRGWLAHPPENMREAMRAWATSRDIEVD